MSYGKLPSGACGLIRLLRVSRLANRHAPSRTYRRIFPAYSHAVGAVGCTQIIWFCAVTGVP
jgi:hypothetical protein